jgi:DNA-binding MarR family transcriptional regulator
MSDPQVLELFVHFLEVVREVDPYLTIAHAAVLLIIARNPGCSPSDLITELGLSSAATARVIARLSNWETPLSKGLGLVTSEIDPTDRRKRNLFLTAEGHRLINFIAEVRP